MPESTTAAVPLRPRPYDDTLDKERSAGRVDDEDEDYLLDEEAAKKSLIEWKKVFRWSTWLKKKYIPWYIGLIILGVLVGLMTLYHKQILEWLKPMAEFLRDLPGGWSIPIGILIVLSFPPLFGQEIVCVLTGVVWGLWVGFGLVCAGTFIGELANFVVFKYWCRERAEKVEAKDISYACLSYVVREGGILIGVIVRLSAIPGHFSTVVFSTCGMSIWSFTIAAILSLPKQLIVVYLGVIVENTEATKSSKIISNVVLAVSFLVTVFAAWWIWRKMNQARPVVLRERRRLNRLKRAAAMEGGAFPDFPTSSTSVDSLNASTPRKKPSPSQTGYEIEYVQDENPPREWQRFSEEREHRNPHLALGMDPQVSSYEREGADQSSYYTSPFPVDTSTPPRRHYHQQEQQQQPIASSSGNASPFRDPYDQHQPLSQSQPAYYPGPGRRTSYDSHAPSPSAAPLSSSFRAQHQPLPYQQHQQQQSNPQAPSAYPQTTTETTGGDPPQQRLDSYAPSLAPAYSFVEQSEQHQEERQQRVVTLEDGGDTWRGRR